MAARKSPTRKSPPSLMDALAAHTTNPYVYGGGSAAKPAKGNAPPGSQRKKKRRPKSGPARPGDTIVVV